MKRILVVAIIAFTFLAHADNVSSIATLAAMEDLKIQATSVPTLVEAKQIRTGSSDTWIVTLGYANLPNFKITLQGPKGFLNNNKNKFRVLFFAAGFSSSGESTNLFGEIPNTVFVGFNYPFGYEDIVSNPETILHTFRYTPGMIALSLKWVTLQSWSDKNSLITMGVSLGGLFLPASLHMAQELGVSATHTVFAFTGSDVKTILENNLRGRISDDALKVIGWSIPTLNALNDPRLHLPQLKGSFLMVYGDQDTVIPTDASEELFKLLPSPKEKFLIHGGHINVDQADLIQQTKDAVLNWLGRH